MHPLLPLAILFLFLSFGALIAWAIYTVTTDVAAKTSKKMERKNVVLSKDGMRVGVKEVRTENYVDGTQSLLVKAWNYSSWPAYKSRFWNKEGEEVIIGAGGAGPQARVPYSTVASSGQR